MKWFYSVPANPQQHNRSESGFLFLSLEKGRDLGCLGSNPGSITFLTSPRPQFPPPPAPTTREGNNSTCGMGPS